jgi:hypothetical protein
MSEVVAREIAFIESMGDAFWDENMWVDVNQAPAVNQIGGGIPELEVPTFRTISDSKTYNQNFRITQRKVRVELNEDGQNIFGIPAVLAKIMGEERQNAGTNDFLGFLIASPNSGKDIEIEFRRQTQISEAHALDQISSVIQSNELFVMGKELEINVYRVADMNGKGNEEDNYKKMAGRHMIQVETKWSKHFSVPNVNYKHLCFLIAIQIGIEHKIFESSDKKTVADSAWKDAKRQSSRRFVKNVQSLYEKCPFDYSNGVSAQLASEIEKNLEKYRLIVYDGRTNLSIRYSGYKGTEKKTTLFIYYDEEKRHFGYITKIAAFLGTKMFCNDCLMGVNNDIHKCGGRQRCRKCRTFCSEDENKAEAIQCQDCGVNFKSLSCYRRHLENKQCERTKVCNDCGIMYTMIRKGFQHKCGTIYCKICCDYVDQPHYCYIKVASKPQNMPLKDKYSLVSYADFESRQEDYHSEGVNQHVVNMAHIQTTCFNCRDKEIELPLICSFCGPRSHTIDDLDDCNVNVVREFITYCTEKARDKTLTGNTRASRRAHTIVFHYGKGYDNLFILHEALDNPNWHVAQAILTGRKIMKMELLDKKTGVMLHFIDFFNFCPKPLSSLTAAFKLEKSVQKLDFPHLFNKRENYEYNEPKLPDLSFWNVDNMSEKRRSNVIEWHTNENNQLRATGQHYNFKERLRHYCALDVKILRQAGNAFRNQFISMDVDPFLECFTLASVCSLIFRRNFMKPQSIGLLPQHGYRGKQSIEGLMWLVWCEMNEGHDIHHAGNAKEKIVLGRPVDGYYEATNGEKIVYE